MDFTVRICGEAGQGLLSAGKLLLSALAKSGWEVYAHQDYESRIRGGNNYFQIRIADDSLTAHSERVDLLVAMTAQSFQAFSTDLPGDSLAIHPGPVQGDIPQHLADFSAIARDSGGSPKMANAAAAGFIWAFAAQETVVLEEELAKFFSGLGEDMILGNIRAVRAGFALAREFGVEPGTVESKSSNKRLLLRGNDAAALGAIAAGLKYISAYPMTPSTGIVEYIASVAQEAGIWVEQAEDEIAAINMAIGASYAGARAMTTTSGGGFCLMTEAVGLAGSAEIPVVIVNGQRPGPSTGLPTRTEQGDLLFAINAGHGDFPLAVLAPGSIDECFTIMPHAFNIADEYQIPVIVLTDQYLADSFQTLEPPDLDIISINRGKMGKAEAGYKRYTLTETGISPRLFPGSEPAVVVSAGDEHDEEGHLIEDAPTRIAMMEKRMKKLELLRQHALPPVYWGKKNPDLVLLTWGSTWGVARQAMEKLPGGVGLIHLPQLWPLPTDKIRELLPEQGPAYTLEGNYSGQLAALLRLHSFQVKGSLTRYDGRPLTADSIVKFVGEVL